MDRPPLKLFLPERLPYLSPCQSREVSSSLFSQQFLCDLSFPHSSGPSSQTGIGPDRVTFGSTITFAVGGPKEQTVSADIVNDDVAFEDDEIVVVGLSIDSPLNDVSLGVIPTTTVTISDDDGKSTVAR